MGYEQRKEALHNVIRGWVSYFKYADAKENLRAIDEWLRSRIRMCIWKCWKLPKTRVRNLIKCGIPQWRAYQWGRVAFAVFLSNITLINNHLQNIYFLRVSGRTAKISKNTAFLWCIWVYYGT